ncbi:SRPBCC family protein [Roseibacillus ishigakijimensis]|uniref:SRPBCC family protein n=1 Tax=Roseibacillus ishigakijimensis TaxID=454146 RepID=A0A934VM62_9BACT|nr:SRPBCC family protein [Roseibacillus ishigakijimensis]MBK1833942.1 SRPBCC family protein [Roseibacillus ishigakijimensis]
MSNFEVERSILIGEPAEKVFATVRDFKTWPRWSPWLYAERDCPLDFFPEGKGYAWDGEVIGGGKIEVTSERENEFIELELTLTSPWKSVSRVRFDFGREGDRTRVMWKMHGKLPFYLFFLRDMMVANIALDYKRGLAMLKDLIQKGEVPSKVELLGEEDFAGFSYVGVNTTCRIADVAEKMEMDLHRMEKWVQDQHITPKGPPLAIYHKWSPTQGITRFTLGFPVEKVPGWLPEDLVSEKIPACRVQKIRHTGSYQHLGNAWAAAVARVRARQWKCARGIHPFEIYNSDPGTTADDKLVTTVHFAVAGQARRD